MKSKFLLFLACLLFLNTRLTLAQTDTTKSLDDLSLENLMDMKVTTASKNAERIQDAPGIMTVLTANEIEGFGALTLTELLNRLTSTYMVSTSFAPEGMLSIRGKQTEHYNTNVLILLDGRPLRESFHGGYNGVIYNMFPINQLERIEIIRGPGSVLYGTNAYIGVVNLITKKGSNNNVQATVKYGSFNTVQAMASVNKIAKQVEIGFGLNAMKSDGWDFTARGEADVIRNKKNTADSIFKSPTTIKRDVKGVGGNLKIAYKGLTFNAFGTLNDWATMGRVTDFPKPNDFRIQNNRMFTDLGYTKKINDIWSMSANTTFNYFYFKSYSSNQADELTRRTSSDGLLEFTNYIKPVSNVNIVVGVLGNYQTGQGVQPSLSSKGVAFDVAASENPNPWVTVAKYNTLWYSGYLQTDYTPWKFLKLIAGGQVNKISGFDVDFVPRLGSIINFNEHIGTKLLYGQAFRSATAFERSSYSPPSVYGNSMLTPEKITTYEAQLFYISSILNISATYFYSFDNNKISRTSVKDTLIIDGSKTTYSQKYVNAGNVVTQGVELEAKVKAGNMFTFFGSSTYQTSKDNENRIDFDGMPNFMAKVGVLFNYNNKINVGLFNSYIGKGGNIYKYSTTGVLLTKMANPEVTAYNDLSLNVSANIKNLFKLEKFPSLSIQCYATNLLNEKIYYAEVVRRNINSLPGRPGRAINIGATVNF